MNLAPYYERLARIETCRWTGTVTELVGLLVESNGPAAAVGDFCEIVTHERARRFAPKSSDFATAACCPCRSKKPTDCTWAIPSRRAKKTPAWKPARNCWAA